MIKRLRTLSRLYSDKKGGDNMDYLESKLLKIFRQCDAEWKEAIISCAESCLMNYQKHQAGKKSLAAVIQDNGFTVGALASASGLPELRLHQIVSGDKFTWTEYSQIAEGLGMRPDGLTKALGMAPCDLIMQNDRRKRQNKKQASNIINLTDRMKGVSGNV